VLHKDHEEGNGAQSIEGRIESTILGTGMFRVAGNDL